MEYKNISVKIIADSISERGVRLTTYELEYPRYIHAEILTHRVFSRNAQSSRAVPVKKALEMESVSPIMWGKNIAGMSSAEELEGVSLSSAKAVWNEAIEITKIFSSRLANVGLHKQWANRMTEWFSPIKVVVTATEWDNFFWLRDDPEAAQPEIVELARQMKKAMDESEPDELNPGDWHLPYIELGYDKGYIYVVEGKEVSLEVAQKVSASCCAQVSYRRLDTSVDKALEIYDKLFSGAKPHLSPVEHMATPFEEHELGDDWPKGATHIDKNNDFWSANFKGWCQWRQCL